MKIEQNITMYVGTQPKVPEERNAAEGQADRKTVFAGDLNGDMTLQDRIAQRKAQAKEQALKIVGDVFEADRNLDMDLENRHEHIKELQGERRVLQEEINGIELQQEDLGKALETGELSQEEYDSQMEYLNEGRKEYTDKINETDGQIMQENAIIEGTKRERLKKDPMVKAAKEAEDVLQAARDEIVGMVADDAKAHIDEAAAERQEQAEEIKEEREEKEEFIEEQKEKRDEAEEFLEDLPVTEMLELDRMQSDVQQEVQEILDKMKLIAEDIKGAAVDTSL